MFQRSSDTFLGLPFNIASTSLLLILVSKLTDYQPGDVVISLSDVHLYEEHYNLCFRQLIRQPYQYPKISINKEINKLSDIENLTNEDFKIIDYECYPGIKAEMKA